MTVDTVFMVRSDGSKTGCRSSHLAKAIEPFAVRFWLV